MAHAQKLFKSSAILLASATVVLTACTKKNEPATVSLTMPASITTISGKADVTAQSDGNNWNTNLNPTIGSDINCYAVFVAGSGLDGSTCRITNAGVNSTITFGPFVGLLPSGAATTLEVASGNDRVFHVVGFRASSTAACSNAVLPGEVPNSLFSEPFLIASQLADVPAGASALSIQPVLNLQKKVADCKLKGSSDSVGGGNGGGSTPLKFGDGRDGKLRLQGTAANSILFGSGTFQSSADIVYTPNSTANLPSSKVFGASRQVAAIDTVTATTLTTATTFTSNEFQVGDEIMYYVSAGNASASPDDPISGACGSTLYRGSYDTRRITAIAGQSITVDSALAKVPSQIKNANLTAPITNTSFCRVAIHRIPSFEEIKVDSGSGFIFKPAAYDPVTGTGGLLALRTQKLEVNANFQITANGAGYGGGAVRTSGSSVSGYGVSFGISPNGSGGGTSSSNGGAGGAGAGDGGNAFTYATGGQALNYCENAASTSASVGLAFSCSLTNEGEARCWGAGSISGNLGDGTYSSRYTPARISNDLRFSSLSTGQSHVCAIQKITGRLYCWGLNSNGQLGDSSLVTRASPVAIDSGTSYASVSAGVSSTCAVTTAGALKCWGLNSDGQVGDGTSLSRSSPTVIATNGIKSVDVGQNHACLVTTANILKCWGGNANGQLGNNTNTSSPIPVSVDSGYVTVTAGAGFSCAINVSGVLKCWGRNTNGALGDGTQTDRLLPANVLTAYHFTQAKAGTDSTCAVETSGVLFCWGYNIYGQLGDGSTNSSLVPIVADAGTTYSSISTSSIHTCGTTTSNLVKCWGSNSSGQLGDGGTTTHATPQAIRQQSTCSPLANGKTFFGGGGAGGGTGTIGGNGGGLVFLFAKEISGSGSLQISANGGAGMPVSAASGGGGGGTIAILSKTINVSSSVLYSSGGNGAYGSGLNGAAGGGGTVDVRYCAASSASFANYTIGAPGGTGQAGADSGALGAVKAVDSSDMCAAN